MATELRDAVARIFAEYGPATTQPLKSHPLAEFIRADIPGELLRIIGRDDLKIEGSPGQGNWAVVPWFGLFHPEVTTTATKGFYVVYLFSADLQRVHLCMGQGVTAIKEEFGSRKIDEMKRRAALIRDRVPSYVNSFEPGPVRLGGTTSLARDYDEAVAFHATYERDSIPSQSKLEVDLKEMVGFYEMLISRGGTDNVETAIDLGVDSSLSDGDDGIEERRRYVRHVRIERNSRAAKLAKKIHGYRCQACGFEFESHYGPTGSGFIEAHHLIPLSDLPEGKPVPMDPGTDFSVLCSNCHRIIHRQKPLLTISQLRELPGVVALRAVFDVGLKKVS